MTLYKTDFSEYATSSQPGDWTERWLTTAVAPVVAENALAMGGKYLHCAPAKSSRYGFSWDDLATVTDVELLYFFKSINTITAVGKAIIRGGGAAGSEAGYMALTTGTHVIIGKFVAGVYTALAQCEKSFALGEFYVMRFRVEGTLLKAKAWALNSLEPVDWQVETTDTELASGWAGLANSGGVTIQWFDFFAAETDSGSWPIPVPQSVTDFSLDLAVQANAFDYFKMILEVLEGNWIEDFKLNLDVVAQVIDSFKMLLEVVFNELDDFKMLLEVTDGTVFDNFAMLLEVTDGTVFDNFKMELGVVSATPAFRSVTAHRVSSVLHEVV